MNWTAKNRFTAGNASLALAGGSALGFGMGLLLAPQSGAQSRADVFQGAASARKQAWQLAQEVADALEVGRDAATHPVAGGVASAMRQVRM